MIIVLLLLQLYYNRRNEIMVNDAIDWLRLRERAGCLGGHAGQKLAAK